MAVAAPVHPAGAVAAISSARRAVDGALAAASRAASRAGAAAPAPAPAAAPPSGSSSAPAPAPFAGTLAWCWFSPPGADRPTLGVLVRDPRGAGLRATIMLVRGEPSTTVPVTLDGDGSASALFPLPGPGGVTAMVAVLEPSGSPEVATGSLYFDPAAPPPATCTPAAAG